MGDIFNDYQKYIDNLTVLNAYENEELSQAYKNGNMDAFYKLYYGNLRLVMLIATKYFSATPYLDPMDLIQVGNIELFRLVASYDPEKGSFSSYATKSIDGAMRRSIQEMRYPFHLSINIQDSNARYYKEVLGTGEKLTDEEIRKKLKISQDELEILKQFDRLPYTDMESFAKEEHKYISNKSTKSEYDNVINKYDEKLLFLIIKELLTPLEYFIIYHHIISEQQVSQPKIGELFRMTKANVSRIEIGAKKKLKVFLSDDNSLKFLTKKIKEKYKNNFNSANYKPIKIDDMILFIYLKPKLTYEEQSIYYIKYILKEVHYPDYYSEILGITVDKFNEFSESISKKISEYLNDSSRLEKIKEEILDKYGSSIFLEMPEKKKISKTKNKKKKKVLV